MQKWEAEQASAFSTVDPIENLRVPAVKFSTNDYWLVFPAECRVLARAIQNVRREVVQRVLEADEVEMEAISDCAVDDPPDLATAVQNVARHLRRFASGSSVLARPTTAAFASGKKAIEMAAEGCLRPSSAPAYRDRGKERGQQVFEPEGKPS